jgi:hypothetical protein
MHEWSWKLSVPKDNDTWCWLFQWKVPTLSLQGVVLHAVLLYYFISPSLCISSCCYLHLFCHDSSHSDKHFIFIFINNFILIFNSPLQNSCQCVCVFLKMVLFMCCCCSFLVSWCDNCFWGGGGGFTFDHNCVFDCALKNVSWGWYC